MEGKREKRSVDRDMQVCDDSRLQGEEEEGVEGAANRGGKGRGRKNKNGECKPPLTKLKHT